ncbi:MAG: hypothetical protein HKL92_00795 [Candidatus Eremiobacteraeota bacterium]|nr:hypothetical protein [Candidatus Eremiobacteraeota bacterium]NNM91856.1 hypothetical protein [Candidatus Eremiobacteraeota bacterium]
MVHRRFALVFALLLVGLAAGPTPSPSPTRPPSLLRRLENFLMLHGVHPPPPQPVGPTLPKSYPVHGSMIVRPNAAVRLSCGRGFVACYIHVIATAQNNARLEGEFWGPKALLVHLHVTGSPRSPHFWLSVDNLYASRGRAHAYLRARLYLPIAASLDATGISGAYDVSGLRGACTFNVASMDLGVAGCSKLDAMTVAGSVSVTLLPGIWPNVRVRTESGAIALTVPAGFRGRVHARSLEGNVLNPLDSGFDEGRLELQSLSGRIEVRASP